MLISNTSKTVAAKNKHALHNGGMPEPIPVAARKPTGLARRMREVREAQDLKQREVAKVCKVQTSAVTQWEAGVHAPTLDKMEALSQILGVSAEWLLTGNERRNLYPAQEEILLHAIVGVFEHLKTVKKMPPIPDIATLVIWSFKKIRGDPEIEIENLTDEMPDVLNLHGINKRLTDHYGRQKQPS